MKNDLQDLSEALAGLVETAAAGVVHIHARRRIGSSAVVWSSDGLVVTADHAVEIEDGITSTLPSGQSTPARLIGRDPGTDVAVLRLEATGLAVPQWSAADTVRPGQLVVDVMRSPRTHRASLGIVSAAGGVWRAPSGGRLERYLETSLPVQPGFSGSLLLDAAGGGLGMNTTGLLRGLAMAVPQATLRRVVEALVAHGTIRRGYLGIGTYPVRLPAAVAREAQQDTGLIVLSVQPDSPAEQAGLAQGDVLIALDGRPTAHVAELHALLDEESVGRDVAARIARAGALEERRLTVGARG
ncbi:MAG TPA: S1C family serine protease [Vicinamibacteria bacterium]|jgi:S1-C subfamily serine protease